MDADLICLPDAIKLINAAYAPYMLTCTLAQWWLTTRQQDTSFAPVL